MKDRVFIDRTKKYIKGSLHVHTTVSDGKYSIEEVVAKYKKQGFEFLAITDHDETYRGCECIDGVTIIPGVEIATSYAGYDKYLKGTYTHFNLLGRGVCELESVPRDTYDDVDDINDYVARYGNDEVIVQYNHPNFSRLSLSDYRRTEGWSLIEVYNHKDYIEETGLDSADYIIKDMLNHDMRFFVSAADDYHGSLDIDRDKQLRAAFVMVEAENDEDSIMAALKEGRFYASLGPLIKELRVENNVVKLRTSLVRKVTFYNFSRHSIRIINEDGLTSCEYEIRGNEKYIWIKVEDFSGEVAWCQPIYLD